MAKLQEHFLRSEGKIDNKAPLEGHQYVVFSLALQRYIHAMMDDLSDAGFTSIEVFDKSQMLLKAVMPNLSSEKFGMLLEILKTVDSDIKSSVLYNGLVSLRSLIANDIEGLYGVFPIFDRNNDKAISLFAGYLVSTVCANFNNAREALLSDALGIDEVKKIADLALDASVQDAIATVPAVVNKLN